MNTMPGVSGREVARKVKEFRMTRGWSRERAAVELGVSLRTLVAIESDPKRRFRPLTLARIRMNMEKAA